MRVIAVAVLFAMGSSAAYAETYRLVHAVGNDEQVVAKDLSKSDCERQRDEYKIVAAALGTGGSVTCLPESFFAD